MLLTLCAGRSIIETDKLYALESLSVRYIGAKAKLADFLKDSFLSVKPRGNVLADLFAGTAAASVLFKKMGYTLITNDIMEYSYAKQVSAVKICSQPEFSGVAREEGGGKRKNSSSLFPHTTPLEKVVSHLNSLSPRSGFVTRKYSPLGGRRFFTLQNAGRIDAIREKLNQWRTSKAVTEDEYYLLLAALLDAADSVANTAGTYGAFLKHWSANSTKSMKLKAPQIVESANSSHRCFCRDTFTLLSDAALGRFDILYLDPPYNERDYSRNYHVLEVIARGWFDRKPRVYGKSGLVREIPSSLFCSEQTCCEALDEVIRKAVENCDAKHLFLSYNSEGIIPDRAVRAVFREYGKPRTFRRFEHAYKRYRSDSDGKKRKYSGDRVIEYLYYVEAR
jgi:adenine-specific DNA methylase